MRSPAGWVCGAALVAVVAGCAGVPGSGRVHIAGAPPPVSGLVSSNVRRFPAGPSVGLTRTQLVGGFLSALIDSDSNYGTARSYLAPGTSWNSRAHTTLYDQNTTVFTRVSPHQVSVGLRRVGIIDSRGGYRIAPATLNVRFGVVRRAGEWRISHLPPGVLLSTSDAQRSLQPVAVYFLNHTESRLVPEPILVPPDQPSLATTLISTLLAGPRRSLAPAVATAVPAGTSLAGNVPIDSSGVAEINLAGAVQPLSSQELERLSAQIVWTLRQLSGVTAVRLLNNGAPLSSAGVESLQPVGAWPEFDPATPPTSEGALFSDQGRIVGIDRAVPTAFLHRSLLAPVVSADGATFAALQDVFGQMTLRVGSTRGPLRARLSGLRLSAPAFDPEGDVIIVKGSGARSMLFEVPPEGRVREVDVSPEIRDKGISAVAVSRDGSRIAMLVGPPGGEALVVGGLSTSRGTLVVDGGTVVIAAAHAVSGVAWAGANDIVTTVRASKDRRAVVETSVDGYHLHVVSSVGLATDPTQVGAAPGQPLLAGAGGAVWSLSDRRWRRVSTGGQPSYSG